MEIYFWNFLVIFAKIMIIVLAFSFFIAIWALLEFAYEQITGRGRNLGRD